MKQSVITKKTTFSFKEIFSYKALLYILTFRHLKLRYRQTLLGIFWVILQPLLICSVFALIFGKFAVLPSDDVPYTLFALSGYLPWYFFFQTLHRASTSFVNERELITKVYFPRILLPLSIACALIVDFLIGICLFCILSFLLRYTLSFQLLFVPLLFIPLFLFSCGASFIFSSLTIFYRDFSLIIPFFLQLGMYLCPIAYSEKIIPQVYENMYHLNPFVGILQTFRWALLGMDTFPFGSFFYACSTSIVIVMIGLVFFQKTERKFVDYL